MRTDIGQKAEALARAAAKAKEPKARIGLIMNLIEKITVLDAAAALFLDYKDISDKQQEVIQTIKALGFTIALDIPEITEEHLNEN